MMQRDVWTVLHLALSRRFCTNDRMLSYRTLPCCLYSGIVFTKVSSAETLRWYRSLPQILSGAKATPWQTRANPMRPLISSLQGRVSHRRWLSMVDMSQGCSPGSKPKTGPKRTQKENISKLRKYKYFTSHKLWSPKFKNRFYQKKPSYHKEYLTPKYSTWHQLFFYKIT